MKNRKIASVILVAGMMLSAMPFAVSARAFSPRVANVGEITVKDRDGNVIGTGTYERVEDGDDAGAYASCTNHSDYYTHAACRLQALKNDGTVLDSDSGSNKITAYCFVNVSSSCRTIVGKWAIYIPVNGLVPPTDPQVEKTYNL